MPVLTSTNKHSNGIPQDYNIEAIRKQFPALQDKTISMNNAAGSLVHRGAIDSIVQSLSAIQLDLDGGDIKSDRDIEEREARYKELAAFMNAEPDEIAFGPSTTALIRNLTLSLCPSLNSDSEMIVSVLCHEAGITGWVALAKSLGITIKWWAPPPGAESKTNPQLSIETLKPLLSPKTRLVTCGHINNIIGTIHPIREIADLVHTIPGAMISVDGVAWAPHRAIDVKALDVDFYVFSWYKVFGPHFAQIYVRRSVQQRSLTSLNHYHLDPTPLDTKIRIGTNCYELEDCLIPIMRHLHHISWAKIAEHEVIIAKPLLAYLNDNSDRYTLYGEKTADPNLRVSCISFTVNSFNSDVIASEIHNNSNFRIIAGDCYSLRPVHDLLGVGDAGVLRLTPRNLTPFLTSVRESPQYPSSHGRFKGPKYGSLLRNEDQDEEEPQEQQGAKRRHQDGARRPAAASISDEDDEEPRLAKRRKLPLVSTDVALTPPLEHSPKPCLRQPHGLAPSSTTQPEMDESPPQADHGHLSTPGDDKHHYTPPTSRSPSVTVESAPVAEYREWPFQGFLRRITIGNQTTYNLEFALPRIPEHLGLSLYSEVLGAGSRESSAEAVVSRKAVASRKPGKELTKEQESLLAKMVHEDETWTEIRRHFPGHTLQSLKENFFTKQGGKPRKRGRKPGVRIRGT